MNDRHLPAALRRQTGRLGARPALRFKRFGAWCDLSWDARLEAVHAAASALHAAGLERGDRVAILSENRAEWAIADLAILSAGMVSVPLHAGIGPAAIRYQLHDAGAAWLLVANAAQAEKLNAIRCELPQLRGVVSFDAVPSMLSWQAFVQRGRNAAPATAASLARIGQELGPDDLATIMYTSGTTGNPKGVMLTHGNLLSNAVAVAQSSDVGRDAVFLNWLPLSHVYARTVELYHAIVAGATLALAESPETVVADLAAIRPTQMQSVPRFYEKVVAGGASLEPEQRRARLRGIFGPRIRWLGCGGAPLPPAIGAILVDAGLVVLPGYGMTESSPVIAINRIENPRVDTVGPAVPGVEIRIADDGEVLTRGPHVMKGYWNLPDATAETIQDGWLRTGDLGEVDADGFLRITGRKKDLLVLSNGKKVAPSNIEGLLLADPCFEQVVVYGDGKSFLQALVVPNWDLVRTRLDRIGTDAELAQCPRIAAYLAALAAEATKEGAPWERVKQVKALPRPFSAAAGEMTISQKLRRAAILARWANDDGQAE